MTFVDNHLTRRSAFFFPVLLLKVEPFLGQNVAANTFILMTDLYLDVYVGYKLYIKGMAALVLVC